jgi:transposase
MVLESSAEHGSQWAAIKSVAAKLGCTTETLRRWVRQAEIDQGKRAGVTSSDAERIAQLERENRELRKPTKFSRWRARFSPRRSSTAAPSPDGLH